MENNLGKQPKYPQDISQYAQVCLDALVANRLGKNLSLGGAVGLAYYYEYRPTHDVDAWWQNDATNEDRKAVIHCLEVVLQPYGNVRTRAWGDVVSVELTPPGQKQVAFSFQIAQRSAQLAPSLPAPWPEGLQVDSLPDLLASKMVALIERGAPRDFRDIYTLCQARLTTSEQCWQFWQQRQGLGGGDDNLERAHLAIRTHLARITAQRPLEKITDLAERAAAEQLRTWFEREFLDV